MGAGAEDRTTLVAPEASQPPPLQPSPVPCCRPPPEGCRQERMSLHRQQWGGKASHGSKLSGKHQAPLSIGEGMGELSVGQVLPGAYSGEGNRKRGFTARGRRGYDGGERKRGLAIGPRLEQGGRWQHGWSLWGWRWQGQVAGQRGRESGCRLMPGKGERGGKAP